MDFWTRKLLSYQFMALILAVTVVNAQGNLSPSGLNTQARQSQIPPATTNISANGLLSENSSMAPVGTSKSGSIGYDRNIKNHCIFYSNFTYTCKTNCTADSDTTKSFPENSQMKYTDLNCSSDVPTNGVQWKTLDGLIKKYIDKSKPSEILATCTFYRTKWYECFGVADCSRGEGITMCAGAAPWRGSYEGTPAKGFTGNITAEAMNSPPMHSRRPPDAAENDQPLRGAPASSHEMRNSSTRPMPRLTDPRNKPVKSPVAISTPESVN